MEVYILKKWLVLSCHTGEGHDSAARAIIEAAKKKNIVCMLKDPVSFGGAAAKNAVSSTYNKMLQRVPTAFGLIYKAGELFDRTGIISPVYYANALYAKSMEEYLQQEQFDAVICTHLFGMEAITAIRKRYRDSVPCFGVLTDYTCIPFLAETNMDAYFIPHEDLCAELVHGGLPKTKLIPFGIPVGDAFVHPVGRDAARNYLAIPPDRRVFLVMSGGVGCGDLQKICDCFLDDANGDYVVYVLVGRNDDMYERLRQRYAACSSIQIVAFTEKVRFFMEAADVMISKPGGLSSTEAIVLGVPMVHILFIQGCEPKNAAFFMERGLSVYAESVQIAVQNAIHLAEDHEQARLMRERQRIYANPYAAEDLVEWVLDHAH